MKQKNLAHRHYLLAGTLMLAIAGGCNAQTSVTLPMNMQHSTDAIRAEMLRANNDPQGHALPLLASWNIGAASNVRGFDPAYQMSLIEQGHHLLLSFQFPGINGDETEIKRTENYYQGALQRAAQLKLPITLVGTQWEQELTVDKAYFELPPGQNPNVVSPEGKVQEKLSPFGPVEPWREVGAAWASSPLMEQLQQWYPNPPLVVFLSNNESAKLNWHEVETDRHYLEKYGKGRDDNFKRKVVAEGWIERFRALQDAMRKNLTPQWQSKVLFVGYDAFGGPAGAALGRWPGWIEHSLYIPNRIDPNALIWDGGTPSYYTFNWNPTTDYNVVSPQIEAMNWVFMQKEALQLNPDFRFGFSLWDGHSGTRSGKDDDKRLYYEKLGQTYNPARYAGFTQFGLWLLRPRVLREFRYWDESLQECEPYFLALAAIVDRVYQNDLLKNFWRQGELVPNRAHQHPYQVDIPSEYEKVDRWFLLDTNLDPPRPWKLETEIPVYALALVLGEPGNRQWLVYAHSPLQDRSGVEITVPDYGKITIDVPVDGAFYVVDEKVANTKRVP